MSSPNRYALRLSRQAEALHEAFETITDNPGVGHRRSDLSERHRAFNVEHHVVVYTVSVRTVNVSRILYERMDFTRHIRH